MWKTLERFGFGDRYVSLVRLLYADASCRVLVNGHLTGYIPITRSVRQGCSLSPLLFVLCMEPFARKLRASSSICGLTVPGVGDEVKLIQYADDTTVVVTNDGSVRNTFQLADRFCQASGSRINRE